MTPQEHYSIVEVAEAVGVRRDAAKKRAAREGWPYEEQPCRGGRRRLYPLDGLPADVRAAVERHLAAHPPAPPPAPPAPRIPTPPPARIALPTPAMPTRTTPAPVVAAAIAATADRRRAEDALRRYHIIAPLLEGRLATRAAVAQQAAAHGVTAATLYRWAAAYRAGGVDALVPRPRRDAGRARVLLSGAIEQALDRTGATAEARAALARSAAEAIRGLWAQQGLRSWRQVRELAQPVVMRALEAAGVPPREARRLARLPRRTIEGERRYGLIALAERDAKAFYERVCTSVRRSRRDLRPGEVVFGDISPADIPVRRPDGSIAYARLIAWRDAATNMMHVTGHLAERGGDVRREHVALAFAAMCAEAPWGLPQRLYLDNGREYRWEQMIEAWRLLARLSGGRFLGAWHAETLDDVGRIWRSEPYRPRGKLIEGGFAQLLWCLSWHPSFAGSDRLVKKTRALGRPVEPTDVADLRRMIADAIAAYHAIPQDGHLDGRSPAEAMAAFQAAGFQPVHAEPEVLAFAFGVTERRRVVAGCVTCEGVRYYHPDLVGWTGEILPVRFARHAPEHAIVLHPRSHAVLCVAAPLPTYDFADPEGARAAARLAANARRAVSVMRGQVAWLEPRELMRELAEMSGVQEVIAHAERHRRTVTLSGEAAELLERSRRAVQEAIEAAAPRGKGAALPQWRAEAERSPTTEAIEAWLDGRAERPELPPLPAPEPEGEEDAWAFLGRAEEPGPDRNEAMA